MKTKYTSLTCILATTALVVLAGQQTHAQVLHQQNFESFATGPMPQFWSSYLFPELPMVHSTQITNTGLSSSKGWTMSYTAFPQGEPPGGSPNWYGWSMGSPFGNNVASPTADLSLLNFSMWVFADTAAVAPQVRITLNSVNTAFQSTGAIRSAAFTLNPGQWNLIGSDLNTWTTVTGTFNALDPRIGYSIGTDPGGLGSTWGYGLPGGTVINMMVDDISYSVIPEPSAAGLLAGGLFLGFVTTRRTRK